MWHASICSTGLSGIRQRTLARHRHAAFRCIFPLSPLSFRVQVGRYSSFYVVNNLVPIILSTCLGFFVFLLDGDDMEKRLSEYPAPNPPLSSRSMCAASAKANPL